MLESLTAYSREAHTLLKKSVEHSATLKLFENYSMANKGPAWLSLKKEQCLVIKDCPKELAVEWKKYQHESPCQLLKLLLQHHTNMMLQAQDKAENAFNKISDEILTFSDPEVRKRLQAKLDSIEIQVSNVVADYI